MAIKIQGSVIIDDSKNIKENTGFHSDDSNSALRPRSSAGGSYLQRWNGSTWETILFAGDGGITCNRSITVNSPYKYYGDGSSLTGISASNADTVDGFHATEGWNNSWCSRIPVVASNGVLEIGKFIDFHNNCGSNVDNTYRLDNYSDGNLGFSGSILVNGSANITGGTTISGNALIGDGGSVRIGHGAHSFIELRRGSYPYIDFGEENYGDYGARVAGSGQNLILDPKGDAYLNGVNVLDSDVGNRVLRLLSDNRIVRNQVGSSRRFKTNIKNLTSEWFDKIYNIVPVSFNYKENLTEDPDLLREGNYFKMGVIAEDLAEFTPEWVQFGHYDDQYIDNPNPLDSIKKILKEDPERTPIGVNYESIFICAVGALQQLRQRVIDLEEEVQSLKASLQTP